MPISDGNSPIEAVGTIEVMFDPRSPVAWGMGLAAARNVSVYRDVAHALIALKRFLGESANSGPRDGPGFSHVFFRGQSSVSARLLPTRLRWDKSPPTLGPKFAPFIPPKTPPDVLAAIKRTHGTWSRREQGMRILDRVPKDFYSVAIENDEAERRAIKIAIAEFEEIATFDEFRQRAAVRHYAAVPSSLLDVTEDAEVAAFFASSGTSRSSEESYGMIWALDVGRLATLFEYKVMKVPGGEKIVLLDQRRLWGDNKHLFDEQQLPPANIELVNVDLPLPRPSAQKGRFLSLATSAGASLPMIAELIWWSMIERWSFGVAFVQTGDPYENFEAEITASTLLPSGDKFQRLKELCRPVTIPR